MAARHPSLQIRDFRFLLIAKFFVTIASQMQEVLLGWQIYQLTHSPLALGLTGLFEALAFISGALFAGHVADRNEKRAIVLWSQTALCLAAFGLFFLAHAQVRHVAWIYAIIAFTGLVRSFQWSASTAFSEQIVPKEIYSNAAAWNSTTWQIAAITGPALGGFLIAAIGLPRAFACAFVAYVVGLIFAAALRRLPPAPLPAAEAPREGLLSGVRFVFENQAILAALSLDMFAVLFGGAVALLPIFAERFQAGPRGLGVLRAAPATGAILMAIYQTTRPRYRHPGRALLTVVSLFGVSMIGFGLSRWFWLSASLLAFSGAVDNVSVVIRASILQALTPNHMRGRVSAVNGIFIGSSNEIGAFESGLAAKLMGTVPSVLFGGLMTLLTVGMVYKLAPEFWRLDGNYRVIE